MSTQDDSPERRPDPVEDAKEQSLWDVYWDRFRRQQVDDPVEDRREGMWDRFKRQQVDDPVTRRRPREDPEATGSPDRPSPTDQTGIESPG